MLRPKELGVAQNLTEEGVWFILERGIAESPQFEKRFQIKFMLTRQMERTKLCPRITTYFLK